MSPEYFDQFGLVPSLHYEQHFRSLYLVRLQRTYRIGSQARRVCLDVGPRREHLFSRWASQAISTADEQGSHRISLPPLAVALRAISSARLFACQRENKTPVALASTPAFRRNPQPLSPPPSPYPQSLSWHRRKPSSSCPCRTARYPTRHNPPPWTVYSR